VLCAGLVIAVFSCALLASRALGFVRMGRKGSYLQPVIFRVRLEEEEREGRKEEKKEKKERTKKPGGRRRKRRRFIREFIALTKRSIGGEG
jgi:hypothetical protein